MGTAVKHPVPERDKPSFVIFDIRALWRSRLYFDTVGCVFWPVKLSPSNLYCVGGDVKQSINGWALECPDVKNYK